MRVAWLRCDLPPPVCNQPLYDLDGALIGVPDLFDPEAGLVGEYDGAHHKGREQHRRDVAREQRFRSHDLEYFAVVAGDREDTVMSRMIQTRQRARFLPPGSRSWTLDPPPWVTLPETLDEYFERTGQIERLTHI